MATLNTRLGALHDVPTIYADELELTPDIVGEFIKIHKQYSTRYELLMDYYVGIHAILGRTMVDDSKPNNTLVDNFPSYITDVKTGYFMGAPVTYSVKEDALKPLLDEMEAILDMNEEQDNNSELAKLSSIYGHVFELLWINANGDIKFKYVKPTRMFMVYGYDIEETPVAAIRYYDIVVNDETVTNAEMYLKDRIVYFKTDASKDFYVIGEKPHNFGAVPVIEYKNNDERLGDFENVITLIDAYELVKSDSVNEVQYFNDAYLVIRNLLNTDSEDIQDMKNSRIISLDNDGEASWLTKNINDSHVQNILDRLQKDIHKFSNTPNLTDESFAGNLSGVAIRFKLWGLEQSAIIKERKFKRGLQRRFELIAGVLNLINGTKHSCYDIKIHFTRNIPTNLLEQAQIVATLNGMVSLPTLLAQLPFVDNPLDEVEALEKEAKEKMDMFGFPQELPPEEGAKEEPEEEEE